MRRFALLALLALPLVAAPCAAQPRVECPATLHDYGDRLPGPLPPAIFEITNSGADPLKLDPQLCCGMRLEGAELPVAPGEKRRLVATPSAVLGDGLMRKSVRLLTNDPDRPEIVLELTAMGKSPLQVFPGEELTFSLLTEVVPPQTVQLRVNYEPELRLTSIRCSAPYLKCEETEPDVPEGEDRRRYRALRVTVAPDCPTTPYEAVIAIRTSCKATPEVKLRVYGLSPTAVTAQPPRVDFEPLAPAVSSATRLIMLTRAIGPFKVLSATASDPRMELKVNSDPSGMFSEVLATFRPGLERGAFRGKITLRTDDPERPRLVIPYAGEAH